ncbi:MAG: FecR family protein [Mangrovibacterium sp.]
MKQEQSIPGYIIDYLNGNAGNEQKRQRDAWLRDAENHQLFKKLQKVNRLSNDLEMFTHFNLREGKAGIRQRIQLNKRIRLLGRIQKAAALLLLPALLFGGWSFFQTRQLKQQMSPAAFTQQVSTQPGIRSSFVLPDGTRVWLNSASTMKFPSVFRGPVRTVELEGEAYFEVAKKEKMPFVVKSYLLDVTALGTAFNLSAYPDDGSTTATLAEGKICVSTKQGEKKQFLLKPEDQLSYEKSTRQAHKDQVDVYAAIAWKDGKLIFNDTPFHEVVQKLGRWFNTDIRLADKSIFNYRYTATFTNESLPQVMELLTFSAPIEYSSTSRTILDGHRFSREQIIIYSKQNTAINNNSKNRMPMK